MFLQGCFSLRASNPETEYIFNFRQLTMVLRVFLGVDLRRLPVPSTCNMCTGLFFGPNFGGVVYSVIPILPSVIPTESILEWRDLL